MLKNLVLTYFKGTGSFLGISIVRKNRKKSKAISVLIIISILYLVLLGGFSMVMQFANLIKISFNSAIFQLIFATFMISLIFILQSADNLLLTSKDLNILKPLYIKSNTLILSRFIILASQVITFSLLVFIPFIIALLLTASFNIFVYILLLLLFIAVSCFIVFLMSSLSYIGARIVIVKKIKTVALYGASIFVFLYFFKNFMNFENMDNFINNTKVLVTTNQIIRLLIIILVLSVLAIVLYFVSKLSYEKLELLGAKREKLKVKKEISYKKSSISVTLLKREVRNIFFSSSVYMELMMELLLPILLIVIYSLMGIMDDLLLSFSFITNYQYLILSAAILLFSSFSLMSSSSVSREGNDFYISKTYPISVNKRINAKIKIHMLFSYPLCLVYLIICFCLSNAPLLDSILISLIALTSTFITCFIGLIIDYSRPKLDWLNAIEAVKQNMNGMISIGIIFIHLTIIVLIILFGINFISNMVLTLSLVLVYTIIISLVSYFQVKKAALKLYA